jgi:hypothetical protein
MEQTILTNNISVFETNTYSGKTTLLKKFFNWCNAQEENRFLWLSVSLFGLIGAGSSSDIACYLFLCGQQFHAMDFCLRSERSGFGIESCSAAAKSYIAYTIPFGNWRCVNNCLHVSQCL